MLHRLSDFIRRKPVWGGYFLINHGGCVSDWITGRIHYRTARRDSQRIQQPQGGNQCF